MAKREQRIKEKLEELKKNLAFAVDKSDKVIDLGMKLGLTYVGYDVFEGHHTGAGPYGSLFALVSYALARAPSEVAAASGVVGLAGLGLAKGVLPDLMSWVENSQAAIGDYIEGLPYIKPVIIPFP